MINLVNDEYHYYSFIKKEVNESVAMNKKSLPLTPL
jgi:hypothetical protein